MHTVPETYLYTFKKQLKMNKQLIYAFYVLQRKYQNFRLKIPLSLDWRNGPRNLQTQHLLTSFYGGT